ncbi:hypothetical protein HYV86_05925 [Candidatus Woesearchaeota archaeon]|nr:hypothetical protein [Candidatus Woesearchaeota archaeon]
MQNLHSRPKNSRSKKGIVDDLFDFLFIITVSLLAYFFLYSSLAGSTKNADYVAISHTTDFEVYHNELVRNQEKLEIQKEVLTTVTGAEAEDELPKQNQERGVS